MLDTEKNDAELSVLIEMEKMFDVLIRLYSFPDKQNLKAYFLDLEKKFKVRLLPVEMNTINSLH